MLRVTITNSLQVWAIRRISASQLSMKRRVSFSKIAEVREYAVTLDTNSRPRYSPTLDWHHTNAYGTKVDKVGAGEDCWLDDAEIRAMLYNVVVWEMIQLRYY